MAELATFKYLSDGTPIRINSSDPDVIARTIREKELEIAQERREIAFKASPEFQPSESDFVKEESLLSDIGEYGEAVMRTGGRAARGTLAGLVAIPTELASTFGRGLEAAGVERGENVVARAQAVQNAFAPDISDLGLWAEVPKALVQFGLPGAAVLKVIGNSNKATKILATVAAEGMVAEEDMKSFGDTFLPNPITKTIELDRLEGQERAFAALYNKGVNGLEAAALMAGIPLTLTAAGAVVKTTAKGAALVPGVKQVGEGLLVVGEGISKAVNEAEKRSRLVKFLAPKFRFRGELPDSVAAEIKALKATELSALAHANLIALNDLDTTFKQAIRSGNANGSDAEKVMDALNDYLYPTERIVGNDAAAKANALTLQNNAAKVLIDADRKFGFVKSDKFSLNTKPENIRTKYSLFRAAQNARNSIDEYSRQIAKDPNMLPEGAQETIEGQLGLYGAAQYRAFIDENYVPSKEDTEKAIEVIMRGSESMGYPIGRAEAIEQLVSIKDKGGFINKDLTPKELIDESTLKGIQQGPLKARTLESPEVKAYLGEYTGRKNIGSKVQTFDERKTGLIAKTKETLGRQSAVIANSKYIKRLDEYNKNLPDDRKMFLDTVPVEAAMGVKYVQVPDAPGFGPLRGKFVKEDYLKALEQQNFNIAKDMGVFQPIYAALLGAKGMYQKAKTVYNPPGQIRNVSSAFGFLVFNGNIPTSKNITETFKLIYGELGAKQPIAADRKKLLEEYVRRGIIGTQAQLGELNSLIEQAAEATKGVFGLGSVFEKSSRQSKNFAARLYSAGDDVWKAMNFEIEKTKLLGIVQKASIKNKPFNMKSQTVDQQNIAKSFGLDPDNVDLVALSKVDPNSLTKEFVDRYGKNPLKEFISEEAAYITKNNMPNYSRVPAAIDALRQQPFGNFIAYPSEIIRTGMNTIGRGITELSSNNADIRARGLERLMGAAAMSYLIPKGLSQFSVAMTGSSEEQVDAFKRSFAYDWERNSTFAVTRTNKDGYVREMQNASYTFPYDYLLRPAEAVVNAYNNGVRKEADLQEIALTAGLDAASEILSPFVDQSMLFDRISAGFSGRTSQGYTIYPENAALGDRVWAGMAHVLNGFIPAGSPAELNTKVSPFDSANFDPLRSFTLGNLTQAAVTEAGLIDPTRLSRISEKDKKLDVYDEAFQAASGAKFIETEIKKRLGYKVQEAKGELGAAKKIYENLKKEHGSRLPEEILYRFKKSNQQRFKRIRDLSVAFDDARTLGLNEEQIANIVRSAGGLDGWRAILNHVYIPMSPKASVSVDLYRAAVDKRRNVVPIEQMQQEFAKSYEQDALPARPTPQPMQPDLTETVPEAIKETVEAIPGAVNQLYNRASQFLREQEEEKLMGGG